MKYLVTGGAGFIGSHIVDMLIHQGDEVVVLDNLSSGQLANIEGAMDRMTFIEGDLRDERLCVEASKGCDGIFHEAALVSVAESVAQPRENHDINVTGMFNLLEAATLNDVTRVVFASSAAVYGDNPVLPKSEEMLPEPLSPYAVAKIAGEHYLRTYSMLYGLEAVALRYFNVYGPRQNPSSPYSGVISIFADRVKRGEPVTIHGDGHQTRDFVNVRDVAHANLLVMQNIPLTPANSFRVYNVASEKRTSLLELLAILEDLEGRHSERHFDGARKGDIRDSVACAGRLAKEGWHAEVDLKAGLSRLLESI